MKPFYGFLLISLTALCLSMMDFLSSGRLSVPDDNENEKKDGILNWKNNSNSSSNFTYAQQQHYFQQQHHLHDVAENLHATKFEFSGQLDQLDEVEDNDQDDAAESVDKDYNSHATATMETSLPIIMGQLNPAFEKAVMAARAKAPQVITWQGNADLDALMTAFWKGNLFCDVMRQRENVAAATNQTPTLLNITFHAQTLFARSPLGTGNFLSGFYAVRLAARVWGNVDVMIHVTDAVEQQDQLILPWLAGFFPESSQPAPASVYRPSLAAACGNYDKSPIGYMLADIRFDLRRMAIAMLGIPNDPSHGAHQFAQTYLWNDKTDNHNLLLPTAPHVMQLTGPPSPPRTFKPLYPDVRVDDVVIHFRCGDLMNSNHPSFGFIKFWDYARHISPAARTIGIVTQPFGGKPSSSESNGGGGAGQVRRADAGAKGNRCKIVVLDFVHYLQERHPNATISIYNDANETIALTYARMIMANQSIAGISSFGVFPAVAAFGTGYIRTPDYPKAPNKWLVTPRLDTLTNDTVLFETTHRLMAARIKRMWAEDPNGISILEWFRNNNLSRR